MGIDLSPVETVTFDSFSTLVDVDSTARAVEDYVEQPVEFAREWHTRAANYGMVANHIDAYATYYQLHRDALEYLFAKRDIEVSDDELDAITEVYHEMTAFDDVYDGCYRLADAGYDLGVISNGDPPLLESLVRVTGIGDVLSATVSADEIERHKPAQELYEHAASRLDVSPSGVIHVSNGYVDVQGAIHAGMQGVWLNRYELPSDPFGPDPDLTISTMSELVDLLEH